MKKICKQCGREFEITQEEIEFYNRKNLDIPKRCKSCRKENKRQKTNSIYRKNDANKNVYTSRNNSDNSRQQSLAGTKASSSKNGGGNISNKIKGAIFSVFAFALAVSGVLYWQNDKAVENSTYQNQLDQDSQGKSNQGSSTGSNNKTKVKSDQGSPTESSKKLQDKSDQGTKNESNETLNQSDLKTDSEIKSGNKYHFRSEKLLSQHYTKHGIEMGFSSKEAYEEAASKVVENPSALNKTEAEDGDQVYYLEKTNEFVIVSTDGYIRTYFLPSGGIDYYNRQ